MLRLLLVAVDVVHRGLDYLGGLHSVLVGGLEVQTAQVFLDLRLQPVQTPQRFRELLSLRALKPGLYLRVLLARVETFPGDWMDILEIYRFALFSRILRLRTFRLFPGLFGCPPPERLDPRVVNGVKPAVVEAGHLVPVRDRVLQVLLAELELGLGYVRDLVLTRRLLVHPGERKPGARTLLFCVCLTLTAGRVCLGLDDEELVTEVVEVFSALPEHREEVGVCVSEPSLPALNFQVLARHHLRPDIREGHLGQVVRLAVDQDEDGDVVLGLRTPVGLERLGLDLCVHHLLVRDPVDEHVEALKIRLLRRRADDRIGRVVDRSQPRPRFLRLRPY